MKGKIALTRDIFILALSVLCVVLVIIMGYLSIEIAMLSASLLLVILFVMLFFSRHIQRLICRTILGDSLEDKSFKFTLGHLSTPMIVISESKVLWYNTACKEQILNGVDLFLPPINKVLPSFDLLLTSSVNGQHIWMNERAWHAFSSTIDKDGDVVTIVYLTEETKLQNIANEYLLSRPGCMLIAVDGYADIFGDLLDSDRARLLEGLNLILEDAITHSSQGILRRYSSGRYLAMLEERHLERLASKRYDILDKIRSLDDTLNLTVSIGVGRDGDTFDACYGMAIQALDMAQGRGGDQVAEKNQEGYSFYGGISQGVEKRSKVRVRRVAKSLLDLIKSAESVVIMGHKMTDLDAIGAAQGVLRICKICDVPAVIAVRKGNSLARGAITGFEKAGYADDFISPEDAMDTVNRNTLCVVVDTYARGLVESQEILQACEKVVVIDHHRKVVGHIENVSLLYHEPYASSASELVTELLQYVGKREDKPTRMEAEVLLAGIMLDTRNFAIHTGVRTFEAAALLRRYGAETENVKALFKTSFDEYRTKCHLVERLEIYKGCAIVMSDELPSNMAVSIPQAANDLLSIEDIQASFVAVQKGNDVNISARSMGEVNVQVIAETFGGGGHQMMAGAQIRDTNLSDVRTRICKAIDTYRAEQTQNNKK